MARLDEPLRLKALRKVRDLAAGIWPKGSKLFAKHVPAGVSIMKTDFTKGGRILFERAPAFLRGEYVEVLRVRAIVASHDQQARRIREVAESHRLGRQVGALWRHRLRPVPCDDEPASGGGYALERPLRFRLLDDSVAADGAAAAGGQVAETYPPAAPSGNTIEKFFSVSQSLLRALLDGTAGQEDLKFPFDVEEDEWKVIDANPDPARSVLLLGRSGTGKTICILYRILRVHMAWHGAGMIPSSSPDDGRGPAVGAAAAPEAEGPLPSSEARDEDEKLYQVFITANPRLCRTVKDQFKKLLSPLSAECAAAAQHLDDPVPEHFRRGSCPVSLPLFLSKREWLVAVDGTLPEGESFFPRVASGALAPEALRYAYGKEDADAVAGLDEEEEEEEERDVRRMAPPRLGSSGGPGSGRHPRSMEVDYDLFANKLWRPILERLAKQDAAAAAAVQGPSRHGSAVDENTCTHGLNPAIVWAEIVSFIKGSRLCLLNPEGCLTLEQYHDLGAKKTIVEKGDPLADGGARELVYKLFLQYKAMLRPSKANKTKLFDLSDVIHHVFTKLSEAAQRDEDGSGRDQPIRGNGYRGVPIEKAYIDEVQDMTEIGASGPPHRMGPWWLNRR